MVVGDLIEVDRTEAGQHDGSDEGDAERRAELLGRVLEPARLAPRVRPHCAEDHVAQLAGQQPHSGTEERHADRERCPVERRLDRAHQHQRRDDHHAEPDADDGPWRHVRDEQRSAERHDEHGDRGGQHADAGVEGVETQHDLEEEGDGEEDAHEDGVLGEKGRESRSEPCDIEQLEAQQRIGADLSRCASHRRNP